MLDTFLDALAARGVALRVQGDRLIYDAPAGSMVAVDLEMLRDYKAELIERLAERGPLERPPRDIFPAWAFDDSLTIRTVDVRASIEHHRAQLRAEDRSRPAGRDRPALVGDQGRFPQSIDDHRPEPIANAGPGDPTMEAL